MKRLAFTLVELLVVIAIVGVLVALLLPAIQAAREAARRSHCSNNLRQVAVGLLTFHDQTGSFPSGGWGHEWVGMRDRGPGQDQPGSWIYSILPFIEHANLFRLGATESQSASSLLLGQPLSIFNCTSRRPLSPWPIADAFPYMLNLKPGGAALVVGRSDYAINGGATKAQSFAGPATLEIGDGSTYPWPSPHGTANQQHTVFTGISHAHMAMQLNRIEDGASNTYLVGEKYLDPAAYESGESLGDNESLYNGFCTDNHRYTERNLPPAIDGSLSTNDLRSHFRFGSAHANGFNMAYCDGSVQFVNVEIEPELHFYSGHVANQSLP